MRGWTETDPLSAALRLETSTQSFRTDRVFSLIYERLATKDPLKALELEKQTANRNFTYDFRKIEGIFRGIQSQKVLNEAVESWLERTWETSETRDRIESYQIEISSFTGRIIVPNEVRAFDEAALAIANHDLDHAIGFVETNKSNSESFAIGAASRTITNWAKQNPNQALNSLRSGKYHEYQSELTTGIFLADFELVSEALLLSPSEEQASLIRNTIYYSQATYQNDDFFPVPGKNNSLGDFQQNYRDLQQLILNTDLPERSRERLLGDLEEKFGKSR